jgi:hypothetical protein
MTKILYNNESVKRSKIIPKKRCLYRYYCRTSLNCIVNQLEPLCTQVSDTTIIQTCLKTSPQHKHLFYKQIQNTDFKCNPVTRRNSNFSHINKIGTRKFSIYGVVTGTIEAVSVKYIGAHKFDTKLPPHPFYFIRSIITNLGRHNQCGALFTLTSRKFDDAL